MATDIDVTPLLRQPLYDRSDLLNAQEESPPLSPDLCTQPVPRALAGVIVYVEVRSIDSRENRSSAIASQLEALGATVSSRFTKDVTHVVFKDGKSSVKEKAEKTRVYLVSPLWVEACKRANDWISEAKYPVITRDTADPSSTPVVLGKIKRIKSMQPKPLEEEIAKSLERTRKRLQPVREVEREEKRRRRNTCEDRRPFLDLDREEDSGLGLPAITLPLTPRHPLSEKTSNTVTPLLTVNNVTKKQQPKQRQANNITSATDDELRDEPSSNVVAMMSNQSKRTSSKVVTKETKGIKTKSSKTQSVRSKGTATVMKCTVVAGQRGKAGSRSKKAIVKTAIAAKKATCKRRVEKAGTKKHLETEPSEQSVTPPSSNKKRRRNATKPFSRELPRVVMTSVHTSDQDVVISVVKRFGRFTISSTVDDLTSHVVCGRARRTINILTATVRGCWILSLDWMWKSLEAGKWLPEEPFEMTNSFPAAQFFRLERAAAGLLFRATFFSEVGSVYVCLTSSPPALQLEQLLSSGGANVTRSLRKADVCVGCHSLRHLGEGAAEGEGGSMATICVTEAWILDSISAHHVLPYDGYISGKPESRPTSPEL